MKLAIFATALLALALTITAALAQQPGPGTVPNLQQKVQETLGQLLFQNLSAQTQIEQQAQQLKTQADQIKQLQQQQAPTAPKK